VIPAGMKKTKIAKNLSAKGLFFTRQACGKKI
jgi:hypothetical protein